MSEGRRGATLSHARRLGPLAGALALLCLGARPQGDASGEGLARYLPADAVAVVSFPDLTATLQDCPSLPFWKIHGEKAVGDFLAPPFKQLREWIEAGRKKVAESKGVDPGVLLETKFRAIEIALARLRFSEGGGTPEVGVAFRFDAGADFPKVRALYDQCREKIPPGGAVVREEKVGARTFTVVRPTQAPGAAVFWSAEGTSVYSAMGTPGSGFADEFFDRVSGKTATPSLAADPEFRACTGRVGNAGSEFRLFLRVAPLFDLAVKGLSMAPADALPSFLTPLGVKAALSALGLDGLRALAFASTAEGDHSVNETFVLAPSPRKGLLALGGDAPVDLALLERVPAEACSFSVQGLRVGELWDTLFRALGALSTEWEKKVADAIARLETANGVNIRKDLLGSIGEQCVSYSKPTKGLAIGMAPDVTFLVPLRDPAAFEKAARALSDALVGTGSVALKEADLEGTKIRSFSIKMGGGGGGFPGLGMNPFASIAPAYAVKGNLLVASLSRTSLQRALRQLGQGGGEGGAANEGYRRFAGKIPSGVAGISYGDPRPTVGMLYTTVTSFLPLAAAGHDLPFDLNSLPPAEAITKHLFGKVSYSKGDKEGIYSCSFSPWGVDTVLGLGVVAAAGASSFASYKAAHPRGGKEEVVLAPGGKEDPVERTRRELRDLQSGLTVYKMDHDGVPTSLAELLKSSAEYPDGLLAPRKEIPRDPWGNDYVYEASADGKSYKLRSKGPNGRDEGGSGDDVVGK